MKLTTRTALLLAGTAMMAACSPASYDAPATSSDTMVEARYHFDETDGLRNLLAKGLYLAEVIDFSGDTLDPATRLTYSYPMDFAEMPLPTPGGNWNTGATVLGSDGMNVENQVYSFGQFTTLTIGACSYQMMPIEIRYPVQEEDTEAVDTLHWLPDLGLSYLAGSQQGQEVDRYDYVGISAVQ